MLGREHERGGPSVLAEKEPSLVWNPGRRGGALCNLIPAGMSLSRSICVPWPGGAEGQEVRMTHEQLNIPARSVSNLEMVCRLRKVPSL